MPTSPRVVYWDSCVFIHALQQTPQWVTTLKAIVEAGQAGKAKIVTSALTLAEVLGKKPADFSPEDEVLVRQLFENPYIAVRDVTRPVATHARELVVRHGLRPPDAIHVATALDARAAVFHTTDGHGKRRGLVDLNGKVGSPQLSIQPPSWTVQTQLPHTEAAEADA